MTENNGQPAEEYDEWGPGTEIAVRAQDPGRDVVDGWVAHARAIFYLAEQLAPTEFVPRPLRNKEAACAATVLMGRELGIGPMFSFRAVQVIEGTPSLSSEFKRARVLAAGHQIEVTELTNTRCVVRGKRRGQTNWLQLAYSMDDAKLAGLIRPKSPWETRPRRMLLARATSDLCDAIFPDVVLGLPTTELVEQDFEGYAENGEGPAALPAGTPAAPAATAKRRTPAGRSRATPVRNRRSSAPGPGVQPDDPGTGEEMPELIPEGEGASGEAGGQTAIPLGGGEQEPLPEPPADPAPQRDASAKATKPQRDMLQARFRDEFDIKDRDLRLRVATAVTARSIGTFNDLTSGEVREISDVLTAARTAATPQRSPFKTLGAMITQLERRAREQAEAQADAPEIVPDDAGAPPPGEEPPL